MISLDLMSKANKLSWAANFNAWKFRMKNIFMGDNLWRFTNPNVINLERSDVAEHEMFEQEKIKVVTTIALFVKKLCVMWLHVY